MNRNLLLLKNNTEQQYRIQKKTISWGEERC